MVLTVILFFIGLFVLVGALQERGVLTEIAKGIADVTEGSFTATIIGILWVSAIGSAAVDNIPFTAAMIPVIKDVQEITGNTSDTYWWALALGADFGGNGTLIGAAANVAAAGLPSGPGTRSPSSVT